MMQSVIDAITTGVPAALVEIRKLGRTMLGSHAGNPRARRGPRHHTVVAAP